MADDLTILPAYFNRQDRRDAKAQSPSFIDLLFNGSPFSLADLGLSVMT